MKKILIVGALAPEIKEVKQEIKKLDLKGIKISYLVTGVGNYNMIYNLTRYLEENKDIGFVINIGVCGYIPLSQGFPPREKGVEKVIQIGRIKNIMNNKELLVPIFVDFSKIESIFCSEKVIDCTTSRLLEKTERGLSFVDMESYGFEFVLEKLNLPRLILKVPVDKIGEETKNFDYNKAKKYLRENIDYKKLFDEIGKFISPYPNLSPQGRKEYLEKYFKILNLTESQKIIFEKLYNKYEVLVGDDFDNYLESSPLTPLLRGEGNIKLQKNDVKKFLKGLENYLEDK